MLVPASASAQSSDSLVLALQRELNARGIRIPEALIDYWQGDGSIPPDLAHCLGREATQDLWAWASKYSFVGGDWWLLALPRYARTLVEERNSFRAETTRMGEAIDSLRVDYAHLRDSIHSKLDESEDDVERLTDLLEKAEAREAVLKNVIKSLAGGGTM